MIISAELIRKQLAPYGFVPSRKEAEQIRAYVTLLLNWNTKISLTTIVDPIEILRNHFGESIFASTSALIKGGRLADVGTGAGFPGIPLAIATPELQVTLIEPNLKKTVFLSEVKRELRLENVNVQRGAMGNIHAIDFDYVTARALGRFDELLEFARAHTRDEGKAVLWLGEEDAKAIAASGEVWSWLESNPIPLSDRRCILVGEKRQNGSA